MKVIGLAGKKQVGKSSVCRFIEQLCPVKLVEEYALAESLKDLVVSGFGVSPESCYGSDAQKNEKQFTWGIVSEQLREKYGMNEDAPLSSRELLQIIGTDLFRATFSQNLWVLLAMRKIDMSDCDIAIISDVRFPNELKAVQKIGGIVIRIDRKIDIGNSIQHISETALDNTLIKDFDYYIGGDVNRTMDDLKEATRIILEKENLL